MMQSWKQRLLAEPEPKQAPVMGLEKEHLLFLKYFYFNHTLYNCFFSVAFHVTCFYIKVHLI